MGLFPSLLAFLVSIESSSEHRGQLQCLWCVFLYYCKLITKTRLFQIFIKSSSVDGTPASNIHQWEHADTTSAIAKFEDECSPSNEGYSVSFGDIKNPHGYDVTQLLYTLYDTLGCLDNQAVNTTFTPSHMLHGQTVFTFPFFVHKPSAAYAQPESAAGQLSLEFKFGNVQAENLSMFVLLSRNTTMHLHRDTTVLIA